MLIQNLLISEYELGFGLYPYVLTHINDSVALFMVYLSIVFVLGMCTLFVYTETLMASALEVLYEHGVPCEGFRRWMAQLFICVVMFLIGIIFTTRVCILVVVIC